jgi:type IV secretory pathway TrbD component
MLTVTLYSGFYHPSLFGGIDKKLAITLSGLTFLPSFGAFFYLGALYGLLVSFLLVSVASAVWAFCAYQTKKDPAWLPSWVKHLKLKDYYHA